MRVSPPPRPDPGGWPLLAPSPFVCFLSPQHLLSIAPLCSLVRLPRGHVRTRERADRPLSTDDAHPHALGPPRLSSNEDARALPWLPPLSSLVPPSVVPPPLKQHSPLSPLSSRSPLSPAPPPLPPAITQQALLLSHTSVSQSRRLGPPCLHSQRRVRVRHRALGLGPRALALSSLLPALALPALAVGRGQPTHTVSRVCALRQG